MSLYGVNELPEAPVDGTRRVQRAVRGDITSEVGESFLQGTVELAVGDAHGCIGISVASIIAISVQQDRLNAANGVQVSRVSGISNLD